MNSNLPIQTETPEAPVDVEKRGNAAQSKRFAKGVPRCAWISMPLMMLFAVSGCKKETPPPPPPPIVQVMEIKPANAPSSVEFIGQLDSPENVEVRARVEAFVD